MIYFILSIIITIIDFIFCIIGVSIIFTKGEKIIFGTIKSFVTNPEKNVFIAKTIMIIITGIDYLIGNSRSIIPLSAFFFGTIILYSFYNEHCFNTSNDFRQIYNYSLSLIYFLSGLFVLIGYILKDENERKGYFYFYLLFCIIFLFIINYAVFKIKTINFTDNSQKLNELEIFLQYRNVLLSIKKKNYNRELMITFFQYINYSNYNKKIEENFLNEENENYNLYCIVEKSLKRRMVLFKNSLLLKILHFIILKYYLKNHKGAYLLLYQLNYDLDNYIINGDLSEKFFIFRIKKSIEDDSIDFHFDKNEISMRFQINTLIDLIITISELYFSFWNLLLSSGQNREIKRINELGSIIHKSINEIEQKFHEIEKIKTKDKKIILLYGFYLRDILNDKEKAEKYLKADLTEENIIQSKFKNKNDFISTSQFQYGIISLTRPSLGVIEKISKEFSLKLGYYPNELIGQNIKILFPSLLNDLVLTTLDNIFKDPYHYKEMKKNYYLKTNSKYIELFPIETSIQFDEEHNNFLLCKLDMNLLSNKKIENECHIITDNKLIINLFSSNSIHLLQLTSKFICNSIDISMLIREFHDEIVNIAYNQELEHLKIISLKNAIMKHKFLHIENEIKWVLNGKNFKMKVEEILMDKKLIGYYFHLNYIPEKNLGKTTIPNSVSITKEMFSNIQKRILRGKTEKKESKEILNGCSFIAERIEINGEFIPELEKEINYYPNEKLYNFNGNNKNDNIKNYFQKFILNPKYRRDKTKSIRQTQIKILSENEESSFYSITNSGSSFEKSYEYSSEINSSTDLDKIKDEKIEKNIINLDLKSNKSSPLKNNGKKSNKSTPLKDDKKSNNTSPRRYEWKKSNKSSSQIITLIEIHDEDFHKINYKNMHFYIYDFIKNSPIEIKSFELKSKVEQIIFEEKMLTVSLKKTINKNPKKNKQKENVILKKTTTKEKKENNKEKNEEKYHSSNFFSLNIYIIIWIVILMIYTFILIGIGIYYFLFSLSIRTKIIQTIEIHNSLSNLMQNSNRIFYYSYQLIVLQNSLYTKFDYTRNEMKNFARNNLNDIYNQFIEFLNDINIYTASIEKENRFKIENYYLDLKSINYNLDRNVTKSKFINILQEFIFAIYSFMNLQDKDINFTQRDFNFIFSNYESLLIDHLLDFSNIFLDEYNRLRNNLYLNTIICSILFLITFIFSYYFQMKIISKIILKQEQTTDIFFKINPDYIFNAIKNCENFIEINQKDKNDPEHLVSNPHILVSQKENTELNSSFDELEINNLVERKMNFEFEIQKNNLKRRKNKKCTIKTIDINYLFYLTIPVIIIIVLLSIVIIEEINKYKHVYDLSSFYFLTLNHKNYLIKNYNYFRTILSYYPYTNKIAQIKKIEYILYVNLNLAFEENQKNYINIFISLEKCTKDEIKIFNSITFENICNYFENYSKLYNVSCDDIGDGISHYGLYSISIYMLQLISNLLNSLRNIIEKGSEKGFKYDEIYYRSDYINDLYPENKSLWSEYESLNPFLIINNQNNYYLSVIMEHIIKESTNYLSLYIKNKMLNIVLQLKNKILISAFGLLLVLVISTLFFLFPRIIRKNNEMIEEKNMLKIIPKNEFEQIIIQEDIKI